MNHILKIKKFYLHLVLLFAFIPLIQAQSVKELTTAIELINMNVLFVGVDNPIRIVSSDANFSELDVSIDNGTIIRHLDNYFVIRPLKLGVANLEVSHNGKILYKSVLRVKSGINVIPVLIEDSLTNTFILGNRITKKQLLDCQGINVIAENSDFDVKMNLLGFQLSVIINDSIHEIQSENRYFNEQQRNLFTLVESGMKIYVEDIRVVSLDGTIKTLPSIILTVIGE